MKTYLPIAGVALLVLHFLGFPITLLQALIPFMIIAVLIVVLYVVYLKSGAKFTSIYPALVALIAKLKGDAVKLEAIMARAKAVGF